MNLRILPYYTMDHPLKENEKILLSNRYKIKETADQISSISKNREYERIRLIRVHISDEKGNEETDSNRVKDYEKDFMEKEKLDFQRAKFYEIMRFTRSLIIAYILFIAPESFWRPIVSLFNLIAHGLSDYARWCIIAFFPVKAVISTFGTFFYIRGKINLGIKGRWHNIHEASQSLDLFATIDEKIEDDLDREIEKFIENIETKCPELTNLTDRIKELLKNVWKSEDSDILDKQLKGIIREGEKTRLWGEMIKLNILRKEILYFLSSGELSYSTIHHFYPGNNSDEYLRVPMSEIRFKSFQRQAENLVNFNNQPLIIKLKKSAVDMYSSLMAEGTGAEKIEQLNRLTDIFESLRDEAGRYHMGENYFIPHEKGNDPSLFYHNIYRLFGKARGDIINGYRRASFGFLPVKTDRSVTRRVKRIESEIQLLLYGKYRSQIKNRWRTIKASGGKNLITGLAGAAAILFLTASLLSFHIVNPGDKIIQNNLKIGYRGKFINREMTILPDVKNRRLIWHIPRPVSRQNIIRTENRELIIYMIMGEYYSENPLGKLLKGLSGQLGTRFEVIELKLAYIPKDTGNWSLYDIDNKGERRLIRDLSELTEEWRTKRSSDLVSISPSDFEIFFRELSAKGVIESYIRRSFSQTAFSTNIYYGSLSERFDSGINAVLNQFDSEIEKSKMNLFLDEEEKYALESDLNRASEIVRELRDDIEEQVTIEYSLLRSNPLLLNKLVNDPYDNIHQLKGFETLWINLSNYIQYLYRQKEIMELLSKGYIDLSLRDEARRLYPSHLDLADYLQKNSFISPLIEIRSIKFHKKIIGLTEFTQYQEKWKETI